MLHRPLAGLLSVVRHRGGVILQERLETVAVREFLDARRAFRGFGVQSAPRAPPRTAPASSSLPELENGVAPLLENPGASP
jgi:hypothetical protein